jgi:hypothetical protein
MDVNEHKRLSNITLRHKLKLKSSTFITVLYFSHSKVFNYESYLKRSMIIERNNPVRKRKSEFDYFLSGKYQS